MRELPDLFSQSSHKPDVVKTERSKGVFLPMQKNSTELKTALIHMMSHELRTPFQVIQSSAELMLMVQQNQVRQLSGTAAQTDQLITGQAHTILQEITRVTDLLNRLVLFSRLETGMLFHTAERIDALAVAQNLLDTSFSPWKDGRSVGMTYRGTPRNVCIDPVLFELALRNLVDNACKYSPMRRSPSVRFTFSKSKWSVSVRDYGIGIPADELDDLSEPFARGTNVESIGGLGLGLVIVQYIVNSFHGTLCVRSHENKGTTITATFLR